MSGTVTEVAAERLWARSVRHATHTEWYVTGRPVVGEVRPPVARAASEVYAALAELIAAEKITILQEKIYGRGAARENILSSRREAFSRRRLGFPEPVAFVDGAPPAGAPFGGVQLWGVTLPADGSQQVVRVEAGGDIVGREWIGPVFRQLVLTSVGGAGPAQAGDHAPATQARHLFATVTSVLGARGYTFRNVARTWIYLSRILDWHDDFDRIRNAHFSAVGLLPSAAGDASGRAAFPASTSVQGRPDTGACVMDVLAVDAPGGSGAVVRPILRSERQDEAFAHGSAFSRAMIVEHDGNRVVHVSGTASIDTSGRSTHSGDAAAQYCEVLMGLGALLEQEGASLADVAQGTLFCKSTAVASQCRDVARRLCLPALPLIEVVADLRRPELLVELEAVVLV